MSTFHAAPFMNEIGQNINPGDRVGFVTNTYKTIRVFEGIYRGYHLDDAGDYFRASISDVPARKWNSGTRAFEDVLTTKTLVNNVVFKI